MFGSNDKNQSGDTQLTSNTGSSMAVVTPPDSVITPTSPPLNDSMTLPPAEPMLPPEPEPPSIITDASKSKGSAASIPDEDLMGIKQQALQSLTPLVSHLDQTPEEKFKTTMMLIQASDNASLINDAYEAAKAIPDEKTRAQALLDVVNEINYFTQQHNHQN